jgi:glutamate/aspartate transport system permease protein
MPTTLDWSILWQPPYGGWILHAIGVTVGISLVSWCFALVIGIGVGVAREAPSRFVRILGWAHVEVFRNIPLLVQLLFVYYVLPRLLPMPLRRELFHHEWEIVSSILTLSLYTSAKVAEHVRAGWRSIGQSLAAAALATGLTWWQAQVHVVLPLLLRVIVPSLTSEFVTVFKSSSLAMTVGVIETSYITQELGFQTFHWVEANTAGTLIYLTCAWIVAGLMGVLERRVAVAGLLRRGAAA